MLHGIALAATLLLHGQDVPAQQAPAPPQDPRHAADLQRDSDQGKKYAEQVEKEMKMSENAEMIARLQRVAADIIPIAQKEPVTVLWGDKRLNPFNYQFKVVADEDVNAFSLPGGYIYVYEGLLKFAESDDELAGVVAHEIAHASLRHIATLEREHSRLQLVTLPLVLIGILAGKGGEAIQLGGLVGMAKGSGWSVQAEEAADYAGFQYMLKSKYNPVGLLTFMERLAARHKGIEGIDLGIFQTHPPSRDRADEITGRLRDANIPIRRSLVSPSFRVEVKPGDQGVGIWFGARLLYTFAGDEALTRAEQAAGRLNEFFDAVPDLYDVQLRDAVVYGMRKPLIEMASSDVPNGGSADDVGSKTVARIRASLYGLAYRVWDPR